VVRGADAERALVATDGAPCSDHIPDVLAELGALAGLPTIALSVTPVDGPAFTLLVQLYTMGSLDLEPERERLQAMHESYAESMAARLSAAGLPATAMVRSGEPAEEITKAAAESGADIIVTGSRCLEGLDRVLLGSVARNVVLHADASVLIVPAAGSAAGQAAETEATV